MRSLSRAAGWSRTTPVVNHPGGWGIVTVCWLLSPLPRLLMATDPACGRGRTRARRPARGGLGRTVVTVIALASLAAVQWGQGERAAARLSDELGLI